ncbi:MAG: sulfatase [Polyangiaceae bacterium]
MVEPELTAPRASGPARPWAAVFTRVSGSLFGALIGLGIASVLETRWARASLTEAPAFGALCLADIGLLFPVALGVGGGVGLASFYLHPEAPPSFARAIRSLDAGAERGYRAALALVAPVAAVVFLVAAARFGLAFLASDLAPKPSAAAGVLATGLGLIALWLVALGAARGLARFVAQMRPSVALGIGLGVALAFFAYAVATGTTSGAGGTLAIFGVLRRDELDLRGPGLGLLLAAAAYLTPALVARAPAILLVLLSLSPALLLQRASGSGLADRRVALAAERHAPLGKLVLARLRKLSDADKDGFSGRFGGGDCNDHDSAIGPGVDDVPGNGVDEDCSGRDAEEVKIEKVAESEPKDMREAALARLPKKPNVVLLSIDTLRWDLGHMGNPRPVSPSLDALAKRSVVFEKSYALASYTSKSLAPALIGKFPNETHRGWAHFNRFEKDDVFVAERLQKAGVRTVSVQGYWYFFQPGVGFERGFDVIDTSAAPKSVQVEGDRSFNSEKLSDAAIAQLAKPENLDKPLFLWVHYTDPHAEYVKHEGFDFGGTGRDLYDSEIAYVDHHVGRVIDAIDKSPIRDTTVIIVTSDHGEAFGEHGMLRHGFEVWDELIRVPLIVHVPGVPARRVSTRRSAIDLVPTVLDLFRAPSPTGAGSDFVSGASLLFDLTNPEGYQAKERVIFAHMTAGPNNADRQAFIDGGKKLVLSEGRALGLYDLEADPGEKKDLLDDAELKEKVTGRYRAFFKELREVKVKKE